MPAELPPLPGTDATDARRWYALLLVVCVLTFGATLLVLRERSFVKNPDECAYAEQADSLLRDGTLSVGFVRHFHVAYGPEIDHPEDFYPPGPGVLIAAAWSAFGRSDAVSALPSALLACFALPLLAFALARRMGASAPFAFVAAVSVTFERAIRDHAHEAMADLPLTVAATATLVCALRPGVLAAAVAGLLLALGFWLKPTALLFVPAMALALVVAQRAPLRTQALRLLAFGTVFLLACLPWLLRNHELFGDPLYSGNKYLTAAANDPAFEYSHIRKVYWADPAYDPKDLGESMFAYGLTPVLKRFLHHVYEIVTVHGPTAFGGIFALAMLTLVRRRLAAAAMGAAIAYLLALSAVFAIFYRYLLPVFPIVVAVNWTFVDGIVRRIGPERFGELVGARFAPPGRIALLLAAIAAIPGGAELARDLVGGREFAPLPDVPMHESAAWAREHVPAEATVMVQEALTFRHVSGHRTVATPFDAPEAFEKVIEHYRVQYLFTLPSGQYSDLALQFAFPYLERYRAQWTRFDPPGKPWTVWIRAGAPPLR